MFNDPLENEDQRRIILQRNKLIMMFGKRCSLLTGIIIITEGIGSNQLSLTVFHKQNMVSKESEGRKEVLR